MRFFEFDTTLREVVINDAGVLVIKEFEDLFDLPRNRCKEDKTGSKKLRAFKELKYIYLALDWESPYFNLTEQLRHTTALVDSELTKEEFEDPVFRSACRKYEEIQNSYISIRLLKSAMKSVETLIFYLENVDINERNPIDGKPIYKSKDLIAEIKGSKDIIVGIKELEKQVKKEMEANTGLRGNADAGFYD